ncbi:tat protein [Simian immunodeficiency virus]|uniref:Protein Tat n=1 Tax=Simian immunodeficiency virus TaxID=11723 RepID=E1ANU2_SIV|nr:tat protein [Simian immunodeficiency virus]
MDVRAVGSERIEEETLYNPFHYQETSCNKCYCKKCAYHCQLCFLQKALGINYASRRRGSRDKKKTQVDQLLATEQPLSATGRNSQSKKEEKETLEKKVVTNRPAGREDISTP